MVNQEDVDIIVPFYKGANMLMVCLTSMFSITNKKRNIVVVDDSVDPMQTQGCLDLCLRLKVTYIKTPENLGFLGATELGVAMTERPFIMFANSDTEAIEFGSIEALLADMEDEKVAIVGAKLVFPTSRGQLSGLIQHAGVATNLDGVPYHPFEGQPPDLPEANKRKKVNAVTGAIFCVRRAFFVEMGGWDKNLHKGVYEDVDLCRQAVDKGWDVIYEPKAVFCHFESASGDADQGHNLHNHADENLRYLIEKWGNKFRDDERIFGLAPSGQTKLDARISPIWVVRDNPVSDYILRLWRSVDPAEHEKLVTDVLSVVAAFNKEGRSIPVMVPEIQAAERSAEITEKLIEGGFDKSQIDQIMAIFLKIDKYPEPIRRKRRR